MATSNSTNFNQTRNEIIADTLTLLGVYRPGATVSTADYNICSNILNKMVKGWVRKGIHMWAEVEGTLFLTVDKNKYTLSATNTAGIDTVFTTLTAAASGTSLTVDSITGISSGDQIGIELDDGTRQWTTVNGAPSGTTVTITASLTSAAASGNTVFAYTTAAGKPLHITSVRCRTADGIDLPVRMRGRDEFMSIPNKDTTNDVINQVHYTTTLDSGVMYVWPTPSDVGSSLRFSYQRIIEDFDAAGDNADFPAEWLDTLTSNLAVKVGPIYGKTGKDLEVIAQDAQQSLVEMQLFDTNNGSIRIVPAERDE